MLEMLGGAFDKKIDARLTLSYKTGLDDLDGKLLIQAAAQIVKESKWFPKVAEIRNTVRTIQLENRQAPARIKQDRWCMERDRLFYEFWEMHPADYPGFDADFQRFGLENMPADLVRLEVDCERV